MWDTPVTEGLQLSMLFRLTYGLDNHEYKVTMKTFQKTFVCSTYMHALLKKNNYIRNAMLFLSISYNNSEGQRTEKSKKSSVTTDSKIIFIIEICAI